MSDRVKVHLRAPHEKDFVVLASLRRDHDIQHALLAYPPHDTSKIGMRDWVTRRMAEPGGTFLIIVDANDRVKGFVQIFEAHLRGRYGKLGIAIVEEARGQGTGKAALRLLLAYARKVLGLRKLLLEVRADNSQAIHLYKASGFRKVGILRAHYDDGKRRHDTILMERMLDQVAKA
jgi:RimJ/RimL family protein N-acetyltransferase